ncbi:MAG: TIM barrel protein, partial [Firmicutes bacterium]|nr:TIM barrel protein [Bacillota bacterium]
MAAKFAHTIWQWGSDKESVITACKDVSDVGFKYFESTKPFIDVFKNDKADLRAILETYDLTPTGCYFHLNGTKENDIDDAEEKLPFMQEFGMQIMTIQAKGVFGRVANQEELDYAVKTITTLGKMCKPYGVKPCVHIHYNSTVMIPRDMDFIMQNTDPEEIWFCPD